MALMLPLSFTLTVLIISVSLVAFIWLGALTIVWIARVTIVRIAEKRKSDNIQRAVQLYDRAARLFMQVSLHAARAALVVSGMFIVALLLFENSVRGVLPEHLLSDAVRVLLKTPLGDLAFRVALLLRGAPSF